MYISFFNGLFIIFINFFKVTLDEQEQMDFCICEASAAVVIGCAYARFLWSMLRFFSLFLLHVAR